MFLKKKIKTVKLTARILSYDSSKTVNTTCVFKNITLETSEGEKVFFRHLNINQDDYALLQEASPTPVTLYMFTMPFGGDGSVWAEVYAVKHGEMRSMRKNGYKASRKMVISTTRRFFGGMAPVMFFVFFVIWMGLWYLTYNHFNPLRMDHNDLLVYTGLALFAFVVQPFFTAGRRGRYGEAEKLVMADGFNPKGENWRSSGKY